MFILPIRVLNCRGRNETWDMCEEAAKRAWRKTWEHEGKSNVKRASWRKTGSMWREIHACTCFHYSFVLFNHQSCSSIPRQIFSQPPKRSCFGFKGSLSFLVLSLSFPASSCKYCSSNSIAVFCLCSSSKSFVASLSHFSFANIVHVTP